MGTLTEGMIKQAIRRVEISEKEEWLRDGEGRGVGRLILVITPCATRVMKQWMVQQYRNGRPIKVKIGNYPTMSLLEAREVFERDFSRVIAKGKSIKLAHDIRPGTVGDLFDGYVSDLRSRGKVSWKETKKGLDMIAGTLGRHRLAREIEEDEITEAIRPIYDRGAKMMADHVRSYVRAAFSWGQKSEHDYRTTSPRRFKLVRNPAAGIPTEPKNVGNRWLRDVQYVQLYRWLENPSATVHPPYARAIRLLMLTGQRVEEIATLHESHWDAPERIIDWSRTKNGRPHAIPLPALAVDILEAFPANEHGWFFPSAVDPSRPVSHGTLYSCMWRQRDSGVIPMVTNRDLRRTWKTLAGQAGIGKEIRDRIQNHAMQDVSSKNYDRWDYMREKRAAMETWNAFVTTLLERHPLQLAA
ncbi:MAG TPA: integrase [Hyphomonadaceae bacterium]|nr:integrase [Hyphomonadaceae bacterium]